VLAARTGQDGRETINSEVQLVFRKKTRSQVIGAELQEGFAHIGIAATEAGRLAAEQIGPRVDAAQKAMAPKVAAAVAAATPAVDAARDAIAPRVEAARDAIAPRVEAAREAAVNAAYRAAADLGHAYEVTAPRVEAAQKVLRDDVVPRLEAAQVAALAYATPKVVAAREAVTPALESARETLVAGVESARSEIDARRAELVASAETATRKSRKKAKKARKAAGEAHREFEKKAAATAKQVRRRGAEPESRRWPWVFAVLVVGTAVFVLLRRKKDADWTPAPAGDGPVPSYREDPVPSSPSESGKTVSDAEAAPGDATPPDTDLGTQTAQLAEGDEDAAAADGTTDTTGEAGQAPGSGGDKA
jgi:hypothetical protein